MALGGRDVLKLIVDADSSGATRTFDKLGKDLKARLGDVESQAKGLSGMLGRAFDGVAQKSPLVAKGLDKIGLSSQQAGAAVAAAIPAAAVVAGAAITAFAAKGVADFQRTALAAGKFSDATGMGVEAASKWIAVADDIGVGSSTVQSAFIKMEKAIASNRTAFGDMVVTGKNGGTDLTATFLNVAKHLQGIKDPIERANESSKLFGRGFAEVSQLIGMNADDLRARLQGVSDAQIISEGELGKARDFQVAMDNLGDAFRDISIEVGGALVPALTNAANAMSTFVGISRTIGDIGGGAIGFFADALKNALIPIDGIRQGLELINPSVTGVVEVGHSFDDLSGKLQAGKVDAGGWGASIAAAGGVAKQSVEEVSAAFALMNGNLNADEAILNLQDSFDRVAESATKAWTETAEGAPTAEAAVRGNEKAIIDLKQQVVSYGAEVLGLPPERVTELLAMIDEGNLAGAEAELNKAAEERKADMTAVPDSKTAVADFEAAVKERKAHMLAVANTGPAIGALDGAARVRPAPINAEAHTGSAASTLDNLARNRTATIDVKVNVGAYHIPTMHADGRFYAHGGAVPGPRGAAVPATLHGGEYVLSADVVNRIKQGRQSMGADPTPPLMPAMSGGGSGRAYSITIQSGVGDPVAIGRAVKQAIAAAERAGVN